MFRNAKKVVFVLSFSAVGLIFMVVAGYALHLARLREARRSPVK